MKSVFLALGALFLCTAATLQDSLPALLTNHIAKLGSAPSLTATLSVLPNGGAAQEEKLSYSKPNWLRIDRPTGFTVIDGKTISTYTKASNTYTTTPFNSDALVKSCNEADVLFWSAFFDKNAGKGIVNARVGTKRNLRGKAVTEVAIGLPDNGQATVYVDDALGIARAFSLKTAKADVLVFAKEIVLGDKPLDAGTFAFVPPAGSTKAEDVVTSNASFKDVQALFNRTCMPCHAADRMSGGLDLTNYDGIMRGVVAGDPSRSSIVRAVRASGRARMPRNAPALPEADIQTIESWIKAGAKPN